MDEENYILELSSNYITFDPVNSDSSVFYDDNNRQIFMVKNRGVDGVTVKGPSLDFCTKFYLKDTGFEIVSIKFSSDFNILAIQRNEETVSRVSFINFENGLSTDSTKEYYQACKSKSKIDNFIWTSSNNIFFFTSTGIEFYFVNADKQECKLLKNFTINASWFVFEPNSSILLLATGSSSNVFQPFHFQESSMYKLNKFEVELSKQSKNKSILNQRDVSMVNVYGKTYLLVILHHNTSNVSSENTGSHIALYNILKDSPFRLTHILQLYLTGKFAVNIVDDVIVVHHQTSQTSLLFDINLPETNKKGIVSIHSPIVPPYTIKPFKIKDNTQCELYSAWIITTPNIIIDPNLGCLWVLQINLLPMCRMLSNESQLFDFLIYRRNSKNVLVNLCNKSIQQPTFDLNNNTLATVSFLFKKLNSIYKESLKEDTPKKDQKYIVINQRDMFQFVFSAFEFVNPNISDRLVIAILFDYINSLIYYEIPIQYFIYKLLISILIRNESYYQLHQFLMYHVFTDSKQLACQLLALHKDFPPALQLALDMFKRLNVDQEYILEIFLSKMNILRALRFLDSNNMLDSVSARKYLEYSTKSNDKMLFYSVFKCFQERNQKLRGSYQFAKDEQCDDFIKHFEENFGPLSTDQLI